MIFFLSFKAPFLQRTELNAGFEALVSRGLGEGVDLNIELMTILAYSLGGI